MATSLKPLGDRVIVKPKAKEEMTRSGIVLPDTASEKPQEGSVLAVGATREEALARAEAAAERVRFVSADAGAFV